VQDKLFSSSDFPASPDRAASER